jgi:hypothetical protein
MSIDNGSRRQSAKSEPEIGRFGNRLVKIFNAFAGRLKYGWISLYHFKQSPSMNGRLAKAE